MIVDGEFSSQDPSERLLLNFDFVNLLGPSETIVSGSWSAVVLQGVDEDPAALIYGVATITGPIVTQLVGGGIDTNVYVLSCQITTSLGQVIILSGSLPIRTR